MTNAKRKTVIKRIIQATVSIIIVGGIFVGVLPKFASYSDVWDTIQNMSSLELIGLAVVGIWNIVTYWFVMVAVLPGLRYREAAIVNQASTAVANTIPGGGAIGVGVTYAMYTSWGFGKTDIALSALVSGVWNNFVKLGMPVLALALLALEGGATVARIISAVIGLGVLIGALVAFGMVLKSERLARKVGDWLGRVVSRVLRLLKKNPVTHWADAAANFRTQTVGLLHRRWLGLTSATLISHISLYVVLLVTLRNVGVSQDELGWIQVLAAFAFVRLISALPITPGGAGVVELGYTATLTIGLDPATDAQVVAAVLLFRAVTFFLPIPLGALAYVFWRRNKRWRKTLEERAAMQPETAAVR